VRRSRRAGHDRRFLPGACPSDDSEFLVPLHTMCTKRRACHADLTRRSWAASPVSAFGRGTTGRHVSIEPPGSDGQRPRPHDQVTRAKWPDLRKRSLIQSPATWWVCRRDPQSWPSRLRGNPSGVSLR